MNNFFYRLSKKRVTIPFKTLDAVDALYIFDERTAQESEKYDPAILQRYQELLSEDDAVLEFLNNVAWGIEKLLENVVVDLTWAAEFGVSDTDLGAKLMAIKKNEKEN